jgi:hypothetical protein
MNKNTGTPRENQPYRIPREASCDTDDARLYHDDLPALSDTALRVEAVSVLATMATSWSVLDRDWLTIRLERVEDELARRMA